MMIAKLEVTLKIEGEVSFPNIKKDIEMILTEKNIEVTRVRRL